MRKIVLAVAVLMLVTPAMATVTISCTSDGDEVTVKFTNTVDYVRAFALDVTLSDDANIVSTSNWHPEYYIYPGSIDVNGDTGEVDPGNWGSPIAVGGPDSDNMTIEMGSLYAATDPCHTTAPSQTDQTLFKFIVDGDCTVSIAANAARGGVVMEDPEADPVDNLPCSPCCVVSTGCTVPNVIGMTEAAAEAAIVAAGLVKGSIDYSWHASVPDPCVCVQNPTNGGTVVDCGSAVALTLSRGPTPVNCIPAGTEYDKQRAQFGFFVNNLWDPTIWCWKFHCDGDADGAAEGTLKWRIAFNDMNILAGNWKKTRELYPAGADPAADVDHDKEGTLKWRVSFNDLNIIAANWKLKNTDLPGNCPRPD